MVLAGLGGAGTTGVLRSGAGVGVGGWVATFGAVMVSGVERYHQAPRATRLIRAMGISLSLFMQNLCLVCGADKHRAIRRIETRVMRRWATYLASWHQGCGWRMALALMRPTALYPI